jgi:glutamate racemase
MREEAGCPRIAFYDSGVGGLPYYAKARDLLPEARFAYLADTRNFPLGTKAAGEVAGLVMKAVDRIADAFDPDIVVIACNTASLAALEFLRRERPGIRFVGTVPAVKPAVALSRRGSIAILATQGTVESPYTAGLIAEFASSAQVRLEPMGDWVEFVERRWLDSSPDERRAAVVPAVESLLAEGVDVIVLACTHFLYLEPEIRACAGSTASVIDSAEGVARRTAALAQELEQTRGIPRSEPQMRQADILWTSAPQPLAAEFAARFGLAFGGILS